MHKLAPESTTPLKAPACPRCGSHALGPIDEAIYWGTPARDKHLGWIVNEPLAYFRCAVCFMVMAWGG
jgi:hypothetical protein